MQQLLPLWRQSGVQLLRVQGITADLVPVLARVAVGLIRDAVQQKLPGQRIVFVDDLLATGGTAKAAIDLIEELGGVVVKVLFVMELEGLHGRDVLKGYDVESVITYPGK